jgi:hypothetical protein
MEILSSSSFHCFIDTLKIKEDGPPVKRIPNEQGGDKKLKNVSWRRVTGE